MPNISTPDVRAYVAKRQADGAANGTINRELSALKRMFTLARHSGKLLTSPHIPMLQEDNFRRGFLEREQFEISQSASGWECRLFFRSLTKVTGRECTT